MTRDEKQSFIRSCAGSAVDGKENIVLWSTHAVQRLISSRLARKSVERTLVTCEIIEDYPKERRPLPDCLVLGFDQAGKPLHAVVATDNERNRILVVTLYLPDPERWTDDWKTRR